MANDRQNKMWMLGKTLSYMDDLGVSTVNPAVVANVMDTFIPIEEVPNVLIAEFIQNINSEVSNVQL